MNLYSQKVDGSVTPVEKETPVAKGQKRKVGAKKSAKTDPETTPTKVDGETEENQIVPTTEQESQQNDDDLVKELEAMSDDEVDEPVSETVPSPEPEPVAEPVEVKKPKRKPRVPKNVTPAAPPPSPEPNDGDNEPPKWFMNYVSGMKTFQNDVAEKKKPKRVLKTESDDYAKQQWKKPDLRQKVTDNVDSHLTKMYRQIFSNRG